MLFCHVRGTVHKPIKQENHIFVNVITIHVLVETFNVLPSKVKLVPDNSDLTESMPPVFSSDILLSATANPMSTILAAFIVA